MADDPDDMTEANRAAWNAHRFAAWTRAYGTPESEAARIVADPGQVLRRISSHIGSVAGQRICHVQGSHGRMAVALALNGAAVTVIDFAEENRRFALALAAAAGVKIEYVLGDIMQAGDLARAFDLLVLELGVLHYHQDIERFFAVMRRLSASGGKLVLNEFHPAQRKLFWPQAPRDYFHAQLVEADVPNPDAAGDSLGRCLYRFWTLGEIVTAAIGAGFRITRLDEHPDRMDGTIPGTFTLVAEAV